MLKLYISFKILQRQLDDESENYYCVWKLNRG